MPFDPPRLDRFYPKSYLCSVLKEPKWDAWVDEYVHYDHTTKTIKFDCLPPAEDGVCGHPKYARHEDNVTELMNLLCQAAVEYYDNGLYTLTELVKQACDRLHDIPPTMVVLHPSWQLALHHSSSYLMGMWKTYNELLPQMVLSDVRHGRWEPIFPDAPDERELQAKRVRKLTSKILESEKE